MKNKMHKELERNETHCSKIEIESLSNVIFNSWIMYALRRYPTVSYTK